jgi:hypothetical protein
MRLDNVVRADSHRPSSKSLRNKSQDLSALLMLDQLSLDKPSQGKGGRGGSGRPHSMGEKGE